MSFVPVVRTLYQLVCDGCGFERYPVHVDEEEVDIADAIEIDGWNEVEDGIRATSHGFVASSDSARRRGCPCL